MEVDQCHFNSSLKFVFIFIFARHEKNHLQTSLRCHQVSINHESLGALNLDKLIVDSFLPDKRRVFIDASCARADVSSHKE